MRKTDWKLFFADWVLLFGAVYAALRCLQTAFSLPWEPTLWLWTLLLVGVFNLLFRLDHAGLWALGALLAAALIAWLLRGLLAGSFWQLVQSVSNHLSKGYPWIEQYIPQAELPDPQLLPALIAIAAALGFLLCLSIVWLRMVIPGVLWCGVLISPCFFLTDTPASAAALLCLCACLLILIFSHASRVHAQGETARTMLFALLPTALTLGLLLLCFPQKGYAPPVELEQLRDRIVRLGETLNQGLSGSRQSTREVSLRDLGAQTEERYTVLEVQTDAALEGYLYLRGAAFEEFDGDHWRIPSQTPAWEGAGSPFDAGSWTNRTARVSIHANAADDVLYTPQDVVSVGYPTVYDYYVPNPDGLRDYEFEIWQTPAWEKDVFYSYYGYGSRRNGDPQEQTRAGRDCLYLPEETRNALRKIATENGMAAVSYSQTRIRAVCDFVQSCAGYSLRPETCPADEDFCVWFLTEAQSGYCVHFATAATAMYRALGIPARYVEGYVTELSPGTVTRVEARQAHAWVEVCVDGVWQRVDPTPAGGVAQTARQFEQTGQPETTEPTEPTAPTQPVTEPSEPAQPATEPSEQAQEPAPPQQTAQKRGSLWWLLPVLAAPAAGAAALLIVQSTRRRRVARLRGNELGLWYYRQYSRMCRICRQTPAPEQLALAQKARFSQYLLTKEELASLHGGALRQMQTLRRQRGLRRLWYFRWKTIL